MLVNDKNPYVRQTVAQWEQYADTLSKDEIAGCARGACVDFKTDIDHIDVADIVYPGYTFWYDEYGNVGARCETLIVVDIFTTTDASIDDVWLYLVLNTVMKRALKAAGFYGKVTWFDFDF